MSVTVVLVLAGGGVAGWRYYRERQDNSALEYKTAPVSRGEVVQTVTANGQINPVKSVTVGSQVSGIVTDLKVDFNDTVTNGQVIAQIDPSTYQRAVTQAQAELTNALAGLELAQLNYDRARKMKASDLIPVADLDKATVDLHQSQAVVQMRQAALERSQVDLLRTTIAAPIDGVVISRAVEVGQTVAASFNTPTIFLIANDLRRMRIEAMVSEADVGGVQERQQVRFTVDAYLGQTFDGQVSQVRYAPITNQNVVNYTMIIEVPNPDLKLRPGMTANANIITARRDSALRVPNAALRFRPPETAKVEGNTNAAPGRAGGTNQAGVATGDAGGRGGFAQLSPEERRRRFESMPPEERERLRGMRGGRGGEGGRGFGGRGSGSGEGGGGARGADGVTTRTLYVLAGRPAEAKGPPTLRAVTVKTGITDGTFTEVMDGLKEGDLVVTGLNQPTTTALGARPGSTPFGGPFGMRPPR